MRALVVGGGLGGLCAARALVLGGHEAVVMERAEAFDRVQVGGAIHLWHNGMRGLQRLGLAESVERLVGRSAAVERAEMRNWRGKLITWWSVKDVEAELGAPTVGIMRPSIHQILLAGVEDRVIRLGKEFCGLRQDADGVTARFTDGSEEHGDLLLGADGLRSAVRRVLHGDHEPRYARYASWQGVAEYGDDSAPVGLFRIVWGPGARFLFYRLSEERLYWEGIFRTPAGGSDPPGGRRAAVLERFAGWDHPVEAILAATDERAISRADAYDIQTLKRWGEGRVTLLGDAAHAMTNAVGQGANQTIEDAVVLGRCLARDDIPAALRAYEQERIGRTTKVHNLARNLSSLSRWQSPVAWRARDRMLTVMFALVAKRAQRKDMAYEF